jgi:hypothetical protein
MGNHKRAKAEEKRTRVGGRAERDPDPDPAGMSLFPRDRECFHSRGNVFLGMDIFKTTYFVNNFVIFVVVVMFCREGGNSTA